MDELRVSEQRGVFFTRALILKKALEQFPTVLFLRQGPRQGPSQTRTKMEPTPLWIQTLRQKCTLVLPCRVPSSVQQGNTSVHYMTLEPLRKILVACLTNLHARIFFTIEHQMVHRASSQAKYQTNLRGPPCNGCRYWQSRNPAPPTPTV